jgi:predicted enzyme related to lactoylglutathione lyase
VKEPEHFHFMFEAVDYEPTVAFYRDVLGLPIVGAWDRGRDRGTMFAAAAGVVEVQGDLAGRLGPKARGVAIEVADVDAVYAAVVARGGSVLLPPTDRPWGTRETIILDPAGNGVCFFKIAAGSEGA